MAVLGRLEPFVIVSFRPEMVIGRCLAECQLPDQKGDVRADCCSAEQSLRWLGRLCDPKAEETDPLGFRRLLTQSGRTGQRVRSSGLGWQNGHGMGNPTGSNPAPQTFSRRAKIARRNTNAPASNRSFCFASVAPAGSRTSLRSPQNHLPPASNWPGCPSFVSSRSLALIRARARARPRPAPGARSVR